MLASHTLYKIQLPEIRRKDEYATTALDTYLMTRYAGSVWFSEEANSILLDIPEILSEFYETVQGLCKLPSGGYICHHIELDKDTLSVKEKEWLDGRIQIRRELCDQLINGYKKHLMDLSFHKMTLVKV